MIKNNCIDVNCINVSCDYETGERCGAGGTFQVESVILNTDFGEIDVTERVDQGRHFLSLDEVAESLGFNPKTIDIDEV